jgi:hypothetical protein
VSPGPRPDPEQCPGQDRPAECDDQEDLQRTDTIGSLLLSRWRWDRTGTCLPFLRVGSAAADDERAPRRRADDTVARQAVAALLGDDRRAGRGVEDRRAATGAPRPRSWSCRARTCSPRAGCAVRTIRPTRWPARRRRRRQRWLALERPDRRRPSPGRRRRRPQARVPAVAVVPVAQQVLDGPHVGAGGAGAADGPPLAGGGRRCGSRQAAEQQGGDGGRADERALHGSDSGASGCRCRPGRRDDVRKTVDARQAAAAPADRARDHPEVRSRG